MLPAQRLARAGVDPAFRLHDVLPALDVIWMMSRRPGSAPLHLFPCLPVALSSSAICSISLAVTFGQTCVPAKWASSAGLV